jgi:hypothetical protein
MTQATLSGSFASFPFGMGENVSHILCLHK